MVFDDSVKVQSFLVKTVFFSHLLIQERSDNHRKRAQQHEGPWPEVTSHEVHSAEVDEREDNNHNPRLRE